MDKLQNGLVIAEAVLAVLLTAGVLIQTPKASGLGGTIGGGDSGLGGGYRTRRGLERQIYWTTWVLVAGFLFCSIANVWVSAHLAK
jgi:protein translocase SecG subunit